MSILSKAHFHDEEAAFEKLESIIWPNGPVCPHCGGKERIYVLNGVKDKKGGVRPGLKKCGHCRKQFTARVGTVFESSHIPLHKWMQAVHLLCSSKKGISSHQLHRVLEITYEAAWFMSHRIREAMRSGALAPMGGAGTSGVVEADETFIGRKKGEPKRRGGGAHKNAVLSLVERKGQVRTVHVENVRAPRFCLSSGPTSPRKPAS
jgi:transposase-like protein